MVAALSSGNNCKTTVWRWNEPYTPCTVPFMDDITRITDTHVIDVTVTEQLTLLVDLPSSRLELDIRQSLLLAARLGRGVEKVLNIMKAAKGLADGAEEASEDA